MGKNSLPHTKDFSARFYFPLIRSYWYATRTSMTGSKGAKSMDDGSRTALGAYLTGGLSVDGAYEARTPAEATVRGSFWG